ncbi:hypothetical protein PVK06_002459 [Gossypium arboreum]|uniref:Uncharacterized protein n=1 Tax=Gossypium arboreum TaxID=29729 RepID=A0ABR0R3V8_GOSAR|nr:hypothetical protein PVK06_002459 [Gossypium arboreum]
MSMNARDDKGEKIQSYTLPCVSSPAPSLSRGVLGDVLMDMMVHVMGKWFDCYMGATSTSSHRCCDELVREKETLKTTKVAQPTYPTLLALATSELRGNLVETIQ